MSTIEDLVLRGQINNSIKVIKRPSGKVMLVTPFHYPDGDGYPIYVTATGTGGFVLSDGGHTLMHLSYENDIDGLLKGARRTLLEQVVALEGARFDPVTGAFFIETASDQIVGAVFCLGQVLTRVFSLTFLSRSRVASTFYEDLYGQIVATVPEERVVRDYLVPGISLAEHYRVDFCIETAKTPLFIYGIPGRDKARLTTISLQHLNLCEVNYESLLVFEDPKEIPSHDFERLMNVGGEMISSLNATDELSRKITRRVVH